jgi:TRAP-type mannitol/chloroaromatic compound transport system permease large subunit
MNDPQIIDSKASLIDRIFKSWKTTLIGSIIILGSLGMVYVGKATLTEAGAFIVLGVGAFFLKDK